MFFKVLSLWSADEGSLLLWNLILSGYIAAVAFRFRRRRPETLPWVLMVLYVVQIFYLILVLGPTRPFAAFAVAPPDGRGPLPLLQNHPLMAVHPPFLYLGFIGFTVPFAFAMAALITGRLSRRVDPDHAPVDAGVVDLPDGRAACSARCGRTACWGGAATGRGTPSRTSRCCRG